jgi:hypothetical protein
MRKHTIVVKLVKFNTTKCQLGMREVKIRDSACSIASKIKGTQKKKKDK